MSESDEYWGGVVRALEHAVGRFQAMPTVTDVECEPKRGDDLQPVTMQVGGRPRCVKFCDTLLADAGQGQGLEWLHAAIRDHDVERRLLDPTNREVIEVHAPGGNCCARSRVSR